MTVDRTATRAGKTFERDLLNYLRGRDLDAERLRLAGVEDEGDVLVRLIPTGYGFAGVPEKRFVIEAKREKGFKLGPWLKEAQTEANNYGLHRSLSYDPHFVVVHHARGKGIGQAYVTTTLEEWLRQVS